MKTLIFVILSFFTISLMAQTDNADTKSEKSTTTTTTTTEDVPDTNNNNTMIIIAAIGGVVVLGAVIALATRNKNKQA